jgi:hypothetical protein
MPVVNEPLVIAPPVRFRIFIQPVVGSAVPAGVTAPPTRVAITHNSSAVTDPCVIIVPEVGTFPVPAEYGISLVLDPVIIKLPPKVADMLMFAGGPVSGVALGL